MRHENMLVGMRPDLTHSYNKEAGPVETFQNGCLRPILKMQHDLLIAIANELDHLKLLASRSSNVEDLKKKTIAFLKHQHQLKHLIIGTVVGHFTISEWHNYSKNSNEYNKRIINMSGERIAIELFGACNRP